MTVTVTFEDYFSGINFGKTPDIGSGAKFCKDSESDLGSEIGPTQQKIRKTPFWKFITDPAVCISFWVGKEKFAITLFGS